MRLFTGNRAARAVEAQLGGLLGRIRAGWGRAPDAGLDHGHVPFTAWEAELSAYARMRTGTPINVLFALSNRTLWTDEVHLARPPAGQAAKDAFQAAELTLEHAIMHHRHGWREAALLWHTWCFPSEEIALPWPPWDQVSLPAPVIRHALEEAVPALQIPSDQVLMRDRLRHAARWVASAWADGAHRAAEVHLRPGLEERLPRPPPPQPAKPWSVVVHLLATRDSASDLTACLPSPVGEALEPLLAPSTMPDYAPVAEVLSLVERLAERQLLLPVPELRPEWLHPLWGRWKAEARLRAGLDTIARSPVALASTSSARRAAVRSAFRNGSGVGGQVVAGAEQLTGHVATPHASQAEGQLLAPEADQRDAWGVHPDRSRMSLPSQTPATRSSQVTEASAEGSEESGYGGEFGSGAGAGTLGELHIVTPTAEDRAAYWQLRGALAPQIEQLVQRIQSASDASSRAAPRRFRRRGRVDRTRLPAAVVGRENVFTQHIPDPEPEHALCLLIDCSASMFSRAELLREVAILSESAASTCGARVTAFRFGPQWERMEPPAAGAPLVALGRELHPQGGTPFGPALGAAAAWLAKQPYETKRLWVFSDGRWSARDRATEGWRPEFLRDVVVWVLNESAPDPPHPAMRLVAVPTLDAFVRAAAHTFWRSDWRSEAPRGTLPPKGATGPLH